MCNNIFIYWQFCFFSFCFKWWLRACLVSIFKNYFLFLKKKTLKTCLVKVVIFVFCVFCFLKKPLLGEQKKIYIYFDCFFYSKKSCSLCFLLLFFVFPSYGFSSMVFWRARPQVERSGTMGFLARVWAMLWGFQWRCGLCCGISGEDVSGALGFSMVVWTITVDWIGMGEEKERKKNMIRCER